MNLRARVENWMNPKPTTELISIAILEIFRGVREKQVSPAVMQIRMFIDAVDGYFTKDNGLLRNSENSQYPCHIFSIAYTPAVYWPPHIVQ